MDAIETIFLGKYLSGLECASPVKFVYCFVTQVGFIFGTVNSEIGKTARDSIYNVEIMDKTQIERRVTLPRLIGLGLGAFAKKKKVIEGLTYLTFDWVGKNGQSSTAIFEFEGKKSLTAANDAANALKKYLQPKSTELMPDEKKCPFCAEIIKKEAILCRYCRSDLSD